MASSGPDSVWVWGCAHDASWMCKLVLIVERPQKSRTENGPLSVCLERTQKMMTAFAVLSGIGIEIDAPSEVPAE